MVRLQLCDHHHPRSLGDATSPKQFSRQQKLSGEDRWVNILLKCPYYFLTVDDGVLFSVTMKMTMMSPLLCLSMVACCLVSLVHTSPMYRGEYLTKKTGMNETWTMVLIILKLRCNYKLSSYNWIVDSWSGIKTWKKQVLSFLPASLSSHIPPGQLANNPLAQNKHFWTDDIIEYNRIEHRWRSWKDLDYCCNGRLKMIFIYSLQLSWWHHIAVLISIMPEVTSSSPW